MLAAAALAGWLLKGRLFKWFDTDDTGVIEREEMLYLIEGITKVGMGTFSCTVLPPTLHACLPAYLPVCLVRGPQQQLCLPPRTRRPVGNNLTIRAAIVLCCFDGHVH